jgi:hypothetical protein
MIEHIQKHLISGAGHCNASVLVLVAEAGIQQVLDQVEHQAL